MSQLGSCRALIRDITIKTAFLLALVTVCRLSDLKRLDLSALKSSDTGFSLDCVEPKEYKIARFHSSKKVYVRQYDENTLLCSYSALQPPYMLAASDTIARWIKLVLKILSPSSLAKDMRVLSAFFLQNAAIDLAIVYIRDFTKEASN
ncbi:hypothetical protein C1646_774169 [Rhizophagus diaphanus]|nr:hypothetical protein C1646_774169 [Rhizophagus diaphanus] [Rhizophagus sp. MUCL 43196]